MNWPILGMLPALLVNSHRLHDYATELLIHSGGTIKIKGPWFANMDLLLTTDPLDVNYVLSKNFKTYPKGDKFRQIFDILGDGFISSDGKTWEISRKVTMSTFNHSRFQSMSETIIWNKVESGLLPTLESICAHGIEIYMQYIFQRFAFDTTCKLLIDEDLKSLSPNIPYAPCLKALTDAEEAILLRHITPMCLWRLQQLLRVGKEHKLSNGLKTLDQFIYKFFDKKQNEYNKSNLEFQDGEFQLLTTLVREIKLQYVTSLNPTTFLRDYIVNLMAAGKDTTSSALSWFYYNLMKNPIIEDKILREIHTHFKVKDGERRHVNELNKLVYLHGALCESLRLFPPGTFNHKSPLQPDILPSASATKDVKLVGNAAGNVSNHSEENIASILNNFKDSMDKLGGNVNDAAIDTNVDSATGLGKSTPKVGIVVNGDAPTTCGTSEGKGNVSGKEQSFGSLLGANSTSRKGITEIMNAIMEMIDEEVVIRHEEEAKEDSQEIVRLKIVMIEARETMEIKTTIGETLEK
ncbi:cytochrome P450 [Artemisia annua]|uniref:Cytochrome P450 n=1 Tax=Artemisia annua TaxID=35608 RepID=A0A2U1LT01_ARTAN|nr:cytochrome P450 [Artemisia annua]